MAGEYRAESVLSRLPVGVAKAIRDGLRIGLTSQPMSNITKRPDLSEWLAKAYEDIGMTRYSNGLRSGAMVPLVPNEGGSSNRIYASGELFFTS